jgi:hypothetical protein
MFCGTLGSGRTSAGSVQWLHVENVNTLHLAENFQALKTGGLLEIGWNGTWGSSRWEKVGLGLDLYTTSGISMRPQLAAPAPLLSR